MFNSDFVSKNNFIKWYVDLCVGILVLLISGMNMSVKRIIFKIFHHYWRDLTLKPEYVSINVPIFVHCFQCNVAISCSGSNGSKINSIRSTFT